MIVFASRKSQVDAICKKLQRMNYNVAAIHSDKTQEERNEALRLFTHGKYDILVATDIVSRGIDIDDLSHVVNFDVPNDAADYVHRIGRTARAGKNGAGITFIGPDDMVKFSYLEKLIEREIDKYLTPEEIGKSPIYDPRERRGGGKKRYNKRNNNRNRNNNRHHNRKSKPKQN
jgi:superfamily II DNA/RNA helicase